MTASNRKFFAKTRNVFRTDPDERESSGFTERTHVNKSSGSCRCQRVGAGWKA
jgi:hypothetical protein